MSLRLHARRPLAVGLLAGFALAGLAACGSSNDGAASTDGASATTAAGADYEVVPDAEVAVGLGEVTAMLAALPDLSASSETDARAAVEAMYTRWFEFEGTIRANDKELYLTMEDGLSSAKIGVQENRPNKIDEGIVEFGEAVAAYLTLFP